MNIDPKSLRKPYRKRRFYIPEEIEQHNKAYDCWVSFFHEVFDISELLQANVGSSYLGNPRTQPLIRAAGSDISHWFDRTSGDPRTFIDPTSNLETVYCPWGAYLDVQDPMPGSSAPALPWWKRKKEYCIGKLTRKARKVRIINMLTRDEDCITVASEETLQEIQDRLERINSNSGVYTWKRLNRPLDMELTLEENGILDEANEFLKYNIDDEFYIPAIHIYFNDIS